MEYFPCKLLEKRAKISSSPPPTPSCISVYRSKWPVPNLDITCLETIYTNELLVFYFKCLVTKTITQEARTLATELVA